jgi:predicted anti-sigma-YlaC factor YlaD
VPVKSVFWPNSRICWNWTGRVFDYYFVDCEDFREALSARLDDEEGGGDTPADAHLEFCADCAFWYDAAALITRRTRTSAVVAWPDVADAVLSRVPPGGDRPWSRVRLALGAVGVLQCGTGLLTLVTLPGTGYETGAWQLALGVTLGTVAVRRTPSAALLPLLGTLVLLLALGQVSGLHPTGLVSLALAAAGLVLVALLSRMPPVRGNPTTPKPAANRLRRSSTETGDVTHITNRMTKSAKSA